MEPWETPAKLFRDLAITRKELKEMLGYDIVYVSGPNVSPIDIGTEHVMRVLTQYREGAIARERLVEWAVTIYWMEAFTYRDGQDECIASVVSDLEDLDDCDKDLTTEEIDRYIWALSTNTDLSSQ